MEGQKCLVIITIIDGQNFTVPDGAPDKIEATVFAEARFGNESLLRSDPIRLNNSNPEFVTELAWQLDRKSLHQLRVERTSIKLQVFMQTRERRKLVKHPDEQTTATNNITTNGWSGDSSDTHKVELIGYTILDLRSAGPKDQPKFQWLPLLNPKFRKSSYNRPELQLAITMTRIDDEAANADQHHSLLSDSSEIGTRNLSLESANDNNQSLEANGDQHDSNDTRLFTTCLEQTTDMIQNDEIIDNDIIIRSRDGRHWVYDANHPQKCTMNDCKESYTIDINIPFGSGLELLDNRKFEEYYFAIKLFGTIYKTEPFRDLTFAERSCGMEVSVITTHSGALATYFELNSDLDVKLHSINGDTLGVATVQLNQLCSLDMKCRSIEGIFVMQPINDQDQDSKEAIHPSIGLSIVLEKDDETANRLESKLSRSSVNNHERMARLHFGQDINDFLNKPINDTHQLTMDSTINDCDNDQFLLDNNEEPGPDQLVVNENDHQGPGEDDHHYCFTIDLKEFTYTQNQRLIPTLRELVIRYSYPFFGYKDTITTDASMPVSATSSIIVSGFCEFNFATITEPLLTALREIPLNLEIFAFDDSRLGDYDTDSNEKVATCDIILADQLGLNDENIHKLVQNPLSRSASVPIYALNGNEIGQLEIYLCLKDLGPATQLSRISIENLNREQVQPKPLLLSAASKRQQMSLLSPSGDVQKIDAFISETKKNFESWKDDYFDKLSEEIHRKDTDRFRRLYQRIEAKESKRDHEIRTKIEELNNLERKFKASLACVDNLERMLADSVEQMKIKNAVLDAKLDMVDLKISQILIGSNSNKLGTQENNNKQSKGTSPIMGPQRSFDEYLIDQRKESNNGSNTKLHSKPILDRHLGQSARRSSLRNPLTTTTNTAPGIPVPVRSSSLVRGPSGINSRVRSNSARLNLSKETQEKLMNLRKQKAELLKKGCRPNDELIQEINSVIEKLAC